MLRRPLETGTVRVECLGEPALIVENIDRNHAKVIAALAMLPPGAFRIVVGRINAWPVRWETVTGESAIALGLLYEIIREVFRE